MDNTTNMRWVAHASALIIELTPHHMRGAVFAGIISGTPSVSHGEAAGNVRETLSSTPARSRATLPSPVPPEARIRAARRWGSACEVAAGRLRVTPLSGISGTACVVRGGDVDEAGAGSMRADPGSGRQGGASRPCPLARHAAYSAMVRVVVPLHTRCHQSSKIWSHQARASLATLAEDAMAHAGSAEEEVHKAVSSLTGLDASLKGCACRGTCSEL